MPNSVGTQLKRSMDWLICKTAAVTFDTIQYFNKHNPNPSFTPKWSDKPLLKSWEKTKPTLGWPRQTDSLCPACVKEAREAIIAGKKDWTDLMHEKVGEIKAQIIERDGQVWMVKECPHPRQVRRPDGHRREVPRVDREQFPGPRHSGAQRRRPAQARLEHGSLRPRLGSHRRPDQPLQHDVRSLLHGRQPGRLRSRAELGRNSGNSRQRDEDQAAPPDVRAVLGRRADDAARTSSTRSAMPAKLATTACRPRRTESSSPRARNSARRPSKRACATRICSSTASATTRTATARSATCLT